MTRATNAKRARKAAAETPNADRPFAGMADIDVCSIAAGRSLLLNNIGGNLLQVPAEQRSAVAQAARENAKVFLDLVNEWEFRSLQQMTQNGAPAKAKKAA